MFNYGKKFVWKKFGRMTTLVCVCDRIKIVFAKQFSNISWHLRFQGSNWAQKQRIFCETQAGPGWARHDPGMFGVVKTCSNSIAFQNFLYKTCTLRQGASINHVTGWVQKGEGVHRKEKQLRSVTGEVGEPEEVSPVTWRLFLWTKHFPPPPHGMYPAHQSKDFLWKKSKDFLWKKKSKILTKKKFEIWGTQIPRLFGGKIPEKMFSSKKMAPCDLWTLPHINTVILQIFFLRHAILHRASTNTCSFTMLKSFYRIARFSCFQSHSYTCVLLLQTFKITQSACLIPCKLVILQAL